MHAFSSLSDLNQGLTRGDFSSVELTKACLERIRANEALNSFITVAEERALAQAQAADQRRAAGEAAALTGVPQAHKDIICTTRVPTTCGSRMLANFIAPYDATVE